MSSSMSSLLDLPFLRGIDYQINSGLSLSPLYFYFTLLLLVSQSLIFCRQAHSILQTIGGILEFDTVYRTQILSDAGTCLKPHAQ